jgi:hypothetical protein
MASPPEILARDPDVFTAPVTCTAAYLYSDHGTNLEDIEPFTAELTGIMDSMQEALANEARILEGTEVPEYDQNELSGERISEEEWRTYLHNGSSRTVRIPISMFDSSSLPSSVRPVSPVFPTLDSDGKFCERSIPSSWGISDGCGCETDAMNESSECTVPMISEPMLGMLSEEK